MEEMPTLKRALLDLLFETRNDELKLILGGGYGVYLKREHARQQQQPTLFKVWPEARSTNDLDLFLRPELLIESARLKPLAGALDRLGYQAVTGAAKYQFAKPGPTGGIDGGIKIDLLTGPQDTFNGAGMRVDDRRARPKPSVGIHAHPTDEAVTLEDDLLPIRIQGTISTGEAFESEIFLPHPFTFAMMKLFAFRDQEHKARAENARYHSLDIYTILATTSEAEWRRALTLRKTHRELPRVIEAAKIVAEYFSSTTRLGILRMQESPYWRSDFELDGLCDTLNKLLPAPKAPPAG